MTVQLAYGERGGSLVHIDDVERGLRCDCVCPRCKSEIVAKQSDEVAWHFAHAVETTCDGGIETSLHRMAKEILVEEKRVVLPAFSDRALIDGIPVPFRLDHLSLVVIADDAVAEVHHANRVADVMLDGVRVPGRASRRKLIVEVAVTHCCSADKIIAYRKAGVSAIEIDLSNATRSSSPSQISRALRTAPSRWLSSLDLQRAAENIRKWEPLLGSYAARPAPSEWTLGSWRDAWAYFDARSSRRKAPRRPRAAVPWIFVPKHKPEERKFIIAWKQVRMSSEMTRACERYQLEMRAPGEFEGGDHGDPPSP